MARLGRCAHPGIHRLVLIPEHTELLPTFIGIGAQRAGTTWAYNCLAEHPDVFMTRKKELHFFYVNYDRGLEWYKAQFRDAGTRTARGEITPDYMYHEKALRNI